MSKRHDEPAHPCYTDGVLYCPGLSVREWFAGQALGGLLSNVPALEDTPVKDLAAFAVKAADALIARLAQPRL